MKELRTDRCKLKELFPEKAKKYAQKLKKKAGTFEFIRKGIPIDPKDIEIKDGERAAIRLVTTPHLDRDGEILIPSGAMLDDFRNSPSVLWAHDYKGLPIGHDQWIKPIKEGILAKTLYAKHQFAEDVYQCVKDKHLNSNSIGFIPIESVPPEEKKRFKELQEILEKEYEIPKEMSSKAKAIYAKYIVLEHSDVPVASNARSLNLAVSKGELIIHSDRLKKDLEIEVVKDREFEITMDDIEDKTKFEKKIKDECAKRISADLKEHLDKEEDKMLYGTKDREIEVVKDDRGMDLFVDGKKIASAKEYKIKNYNFTKDREIEMMKDEEIDIEEITKDVEELLVIDEESLEERTLSFVKKYGIYSKDGKISAGYAINALEQKYNLKLSFDKDGNPIVTKPETTEKYHHIPVNKCEITATITISASKGIKATYCGKVKKIHTYLFDVNKWTMAEAQAWVKENHKGFESAFKEFFTKGIRPSKEYQFESIDESIKDECQECEQKEPGYKERWNKSLSKVFDVAAVEAPIATFNYALYEKFLECKVKEIFLNSYSIPSPLLGTYLTGFKKILGNFKLKDTRSFTYDGGEVPPISEVIKLNSEKSDDFLINGVCFYDADNKPLIVRFNSGWYGIDVSIVTSSENKEWNKELLDKVHDWAHENNYLQGEKFSLSGEFLDEPGDNWDNLILDAKYKDSIIKSANFLEKKGKDLTGRGLLFIGPPGTGKTKTGRVLMNELDATFIWVSSRDFRHIGPLKALSLGFSLARDLAPSILFLEDIDTWLRGEMEFVTDLVKTEMDGIKQNKGLITIMTSNYPEKLPDALLDRPGRFHHIINFELPKEKERHEMIRMWLKEKCPDGLKGTIPTEVIEMTEGFSGAHLKELIEFAAMIAEEDGIEIEDALLKSLEKLIEQRELIEEIRENKTGLKQFWGKVKWVDGDIKVKTDREIEIKDDKKKEATHWTDKAVEIRITDLPEFKEYQKSIKETLAELKEGRVLSTKNRTLVKDVRDLIRELDGKLTNLLDATEPPSREEERTAEIETEKRFIVEKDGEKAMLGVELAKAIEKLMSGDNLKKLINKSLDEAVETTLKKKMGKVE